MNKQKAFTLAEVLVTLAVVGIVASMTIPPLVKNYQENEWKNKWKKMYSELSRVNLLISQEQGTIAYTLPYPTGVINYVNALMPYLKVYKYGSGGTYWHAANESYLLDGTPICAVNPGYQAIVLMDGTMLYIPTREAQGQQIIVDINGTKEPNTVGKDIFGMLVQEGKSYPAGGLYALFIRNNACSVDVYTDETCDPSNSGWACSKTYLTE